jgi:hypothetical protein
MATSSKSKALPLGGGINTLSPLAAAFPGVIGSVVSAPTALSAVQRALWRQVDSLWSGTAGMRLAGTLFLPQQPNETLDNYKRRLARSTLHNYYKSSIQSAVGKVFAEDIHIEDPTLSLDLICADVDSQGRNISQFAKEVLENAINHGVSFILIDHTRVPEDFENLAAQQDSGARPYWVGIPATKVLDARSGDFGGAQRLCYFRYEEIVWEPSADGFSGAQFRQVRIFKHDVGTNVMFAVYREVDGKQWELVDSGEIVGLDAIPVVPVYTNRMGFFMGRPPLQDLADVNVQHWQCSSDYQNSVHVATIPFLLTKGLQAQMDADGNLKQLTVDVNAGVVATDPNATVEWIEVSGAALSAARANLDSLTSEMEKLGTTLCSSTPGGITATEHSVNAAETNSVIKNWALSLQDAINGALYFTSQYIGEPYTSMAKVNIDFAQDFASDTTMQNVLDMHVAGIIDAEVVIAEAKRRNVLDHNADIEPAAETPALEAKEDPELEKTEDKDEPVVEPKAGKKPTGSSE